MFSRITKRKFLINLSLIFYKIYYLAPHLYAKLTKNYFYEDFIRVYPDDIAYYSFGLKRAANFRDKNNLLNHSKYYKFAAQFVKNKKVVDVGCGSGYGCEILFQNSGKVWGTDLSSHAIKFAKKRFKKVANFSIQNVVSMNKFKDSFFDIAICGEVLEHIKEYGKEKEALNEISRITKIGGLIICSTPNLELVDDHGFTYEEINSLFKAHFKNYCVFENALLPNNKKLIQYKKRVKNRQKGVTISEIINESEIAFYEDNIKHRFKKGLTPGVYKFGNYKINTKLLHNTHSWVILAINRRPTTL